MVVSVLMQGANLWLKRSGPSRRPARQPVTDAPSGATIDLSSRPTEGADNAKTVFIEFSDYECPFCIRHATSVGNEIDKKFVQTGKIRHVFVNSPLPIHPNAKMLATAAICAGLQGHYWMMHESLFSKKPSSKDQVLPLATEMNLDDAQFKKCLDGDTTAEVQIAKDIEDFKKLGLTGTPAFAVGHVDGSGRITLDKLIQGAQPLSIFETAINDVLNRVQKASL